MGLEEAGFIVFEADADVARWAAAAHRLGTAIAAEPDTRAANLRHGATWFVGVDALPNDADGAIDGVPLNGPWRDHVTAPAHWHAAQLSIVYPGYPRQDPLESNANHRFRITRHAAHVDGLLPEGPARRRFLREPHAFILGLPLNACIAAPLVVWPGSHLIMAAAFRKATRGQDPSTVDLTEPYQAARRAVFDQIMPQPVQAAPGQSVLLHRHMLHGVAPWEDGQTGPAEGRLIAYFRPQTNAADWL